ncbi:MAG TPA: glycosyltransferase family 25 protein [Rhizomicrobium sp.]
MQVFLINLARRPDRLRKMTEQLSRLGLTVQPVVAIDAKQAADAAIDRRFAPDGPLGPIPKGDKCCTLSHMRAWSMFLATGESHAIVLEDDVALDPDAAALLRDASWIPPAIGLLKIEHYGPDHQRVLLGALTPTRGRRQIGRMRSRHTGAAAYILSREVAAQLLSWPERWPLPVDHMLFNPNNSPLSASLAPHQLIPAIARQSLAIGGRTDIDEWRADSRDFSWRRVKRKFVRTYYDLRLLPSQVASLARREADFVRVEAHPSY